MKKLLCALLIVGAGIAPLRAGDVINYASPAEIEAAKLAAIRANLAKLEEKEKENVAKRVNFPLLRLGMTPDAVFALIGTPDRVNRDRSAAGTFMQCVYGRRYVYFRDGALSSIQD